MVHLNDNPLWMSSCCCNYGLGVNALLQMGHLNGFTFVCRRSWIAKSYFRVNALEQNEQLFRLIPEWMLSWRCRVDLQLKLFSQIPHSNGRSPLCTRSWIQSLAIQSLALDSTLKWKISAVESLMFLQIEFLSERFIACWAFESFLSYCIFFCFDFICRHYFEFRLFHKFKNSHLIFFDKSLRKEI